MVKKSIEKKEEMIPVVAILGHVDHGKTTLLDYIRGAKVQAKEAGGITQKISVFTVEVEEKEKGKKLITFIDTPGHEAFDLMRSRGGSVADIVLLIIGADDGIKPQTLESIEIIKNSSVKPIVVITKTDLGKENIPKIKRDLANRGLSVEGMGGDIPVLEVSAKTGDGVQELLDMINLVVEVEGLKETVKLPEGVKGQGFILESIKDKFRGHIVTLVITEGEFLKGNWFVYKIEDEIFFEKIKAFLTEEDSLMSELKKGFGGRVIGMSNLVNLGTEVYCFEQKDENLAKSLFKIKKTEVKQEKEVKVEESIEEDIDQAKLLEGFFDEEQEGEEEKKLKVLIKSSSEGSLEAIKKSIEKISVEGVKIEIVKSGIGNINTGDVELASVTKAIVLGFEVSMEKGVSDVASKNKVFIKTYEVIYKLVEEIEDAVKSLVVSEEAEEELGNAEVKEVFTLSDGTQVIGCKGTEGIVKRGEKAYIVRDDEIVGEGKIVSMKHSKKDIKEGTKGNEFGVVLNKAVPSIEVGDSLYCFTILK